MPAFGKIPDIGKATAARPTAGMLPTGIGSNIGAGLAVPLAQPAATRGLSARGFGSSLPRSFAAGMQKGMQVGTQAAMEQARMAQIKQAELQEKIKQAEAIANQGIQQISTMISAAPNRSPGLQKAVEAMAGQVGDLARIAGQFDPDASMRIASNLRFAINNSKTQAEMHTAQALGKQQQPQAGPGQGAPTPSPAVPPPLSGAAVAAGAVPPAGASPGAPGANVAPAAPSGAQVANPLSNTFAPGGVGALPGPGSQVAAATPVAYARPATPAPLVQPAEAGITYGQTPAAATSGPVKGGKFVPPGPTPGSTPVETKGVAGKGGGGKGLGENAGKIAIAVEGLKLFNEKSITDPDSGERISGYDLMSKPSEWDKWMIAQDAMPWLPEGRVGTPRSQALVQAKNQLDSAVEGLFRFMTGAQFNKSELPRLQRMFVPYWGNSDAVAQQKLAGLHRVVQRMMQYGLEGRREMTMEEAAVFAQPFLNVVTNDEEYNALQPGTKFVDQNGNQYEKPKAQPQGNRNDVAR